MPSPAPPTDRTSLFVRLQVTPVVLHYLLTHDPSHLHTLHPLASHVHQDMGDIVAFGPPTNRLIRNASLNKRHNHLEDELEPSK